MNITVDTVQFTADMTELPVLPEKYIAVDTTYACEIIDDVIQCVIT